MRSYAFAALLFPTLAVCRLFEDDAYMQDSARTSTITRASPASVPTSGHPTATPVSTGEILELRQNLGIAPLPPPADPAPAPASPQNPGIAPVNNPVPPAAPVPTTTSTVPGSPAVNQDYVSVQWVETWIGGTSQTWVPKTISFHFKPYVTQGALPGKGEIGMGTLTGEPGKTKTVVMGAAPTQAAGWKKGVAVALGAGVVGMMV